MADPNQPGGISVTLKADEPGGKYNDPKSPGTWIVFHGSPAEVHQQIVEVFTFDEETAKLNLHELVLEATRVYKATNTVGTVLGGRPTGATSGAWAEARGETSTEPAEQKAPPTLAELIEAATSVDALRDLWLDRSDEIKSGDLVDAWKAKGAALKEAAG